jgi:hypothetical protein
MPKLYWTPKLLIEMISYGRMGGAWDAQPHNWNKGWRRYSTVNDRVARAIARGENPRSKSTDELPDHLNKFAALTPLTSSVPAVPLPTGKDLFDGVMFRDCIEAKRDHGSGGRGISRPDYNTYTGAQL